MLSGLVTAFRTLTIFPFPGRHSSRPSAALPFFPVVGISLGVLLWLLSQITKVLEGDGWPMGVAAVMVVASVISTRALHLDGLADLADAIGGGWDRARRLEILKDSHLGAFGAVTIMLALLCKWIAFSRLISAGSAGWVVLIYMISRTMQVNLAVNLPYARVEGGTAEAFVNDASGSHRLTAATLTLVVAAFYGPPGLLAFALAEGVTRVYGTWCRKYLGGITGDLLGAGNEVIEIVLLLLVAAPGSLLVGYTGWGWVFN